MFKQTLTQEESLTKELDLLEQHGLRRTLRTVETGAEPEIVVEGKKLLLLSTNNYLGLATHPRVKAKAIEAVQQFGTGSGGSRLITGNLRLHEELEQTIAAWKGTEAAQLFSCGYLANVGTISALAGKGDLVLSDELNHASMIDGCRLSKAATMVYRHVDMDDLHQKLRDTRGQYRRTLIATDGVFSMDGNIAPLPELVSLAEQYGAWLMVDDAHGTGVLGDTGAGSVEHFGLSGRVHLSVGTLSKACGAESGYVAGSQTVIEYLLNRARSFIFQTALSPGVVAASLEAIHIIRTEPALRHQLLSNARYLREGLKSYGFRLIEGETPIIAVLIGEAKTAVRFSRRLEEAGVYAPAIRPPTVPEGMSRIRCTVMATHTTAQLDFALAQFKQVGQELGVIS
ncbi:8-amino-7-oxononanoate synthase [Caldalkalibacillus uzonensis]|uniref:8-amino-7-oxononanoate synthase n=1 Tax=Caldalkalibacillus uzonensis TaxID=353224 RepID=A0ABU0CQL0_9BACI|nr:8-amino-7-oxononanoate synthase [Caldalkalibacillus uzonensis]MDQ0338373.1 8-amino-7-oxononanoate synthase [Caldalkalibacillus uzonensis]